MYSGDDCNKLRKCSVQGMGMEQCITLGCEHTDGAAA